MAERDLTPGELGIKLDSMIDQLGQIRAEMFTTSLFAAWRDGNESRVRRIEDDQKDWARVSTQAHEQLAGLITRAADADASERQKLVVMLRAEIHEVTTELDLAKNEQKEIREKQDARRYDLLKAIGVSVLVAVLGVCASLATLLITNQP